MTQSNERAKNIVNILKETEFALTDFAFEPIEDENGEVTGISVTLVTELIDLQESSESALEVIENNFIGEDDDFENVLVVSGNKYDEEEEQEEEEE